MANNDKGFSQKQLEQLGQLMDYKLEKSLNPIVNRLDRLEAKVDNIDKRLINVEKDIKEMKNTPTMKKELKEKHK